MKRRFKGRTNRRWLLRWVVFSLMRHFRGHLKKMGVGAIMADLVIEGFTQGPLWGNFGIAEWIKNLWNFIQR